MKKTILFCVALAGLTAMSSCGNKAATKLENAADSASYALGVSNGARFGEALKSGMYEQLKNIDPNDFMKGLAAALKTDSTQRSYEMGLSQGLYIKEMLNNIKQGTGVEIDIPTFVQAYKQAMEELTEEGGVTARYKRYCENHDVLVNGMRTLGFETLLPDEVQSPIITSFFYPHKGFDFKSFYVQLKDKGFVIYPGKISKADTFRIGNIGDVYPDDFVRLIETIRGCRY